VKWFIVGIDEKVFDEMRKDDIYQRANDTKLLETLIADAAFIDCNLEEFEMKVRDDYIRQLKIALLLGLVGATTMSVFGRLVLPVKAIKEAVDDTNRQLGDLFGLEHLERDEITEVLRLLNLEGCIVE